MGHPDTAGRLRAQEADIHVPTPATLRAFLETASPAELTAAYDALWSVIDAVSSHYKLLGRVAPSAWNEAHALVAELQVIAACLRRALPTPAGLAVPAPAAPNLEGRIVDDWGSRGRFRAGGGD